MDNYPNFFFFDVNNDNWSNLLINNTRHKIAFSKSTQNLHLKKILFKITETFRKKDFTGVSKYLARCRYENNFVEHFKIN